MRSLLALDDVLKRDRLIVLCGIAGLSALAWGYMIHEARAMSFTGACCIASMKMAGPDMTAWSSAALIPLFLMWAEMMVAMMLPSAAPVILTFAMVNRKRQSPNIETASADALPAPRSADFQSAVSPISNRQGRDSPPASPSSHAPQAGSPATSPESFRGTPIGNLRYPAGQPGAVHTRSPFIATAIFVAGYLAVWTGFSALAAVAQWMLHATALLSPAMVSTSPFLGGMLLVAAGVFQWTSLKYTCLANCRSPLSFLMNGWREGNSGAFLMGLKHGAYCTGCCWFLMALLFVAGVMNMWWVALIAILVLLEKAAPMGLWIGRMVGLVLAACGVGMIAAH